MRETLPAIESASNGARLSGVSSLWVGFVIGLAVWMLARSASGSFSASLLVGSVTPGICMTCGDGCPCTVCYDSPVPSRVVWPDVAAVVYLCSHPRCHVCGEAVCSECYVSHLGGCMVEEEVTA